MANIARGKHFEEFVQKQLDSGRYSDASEVIRAGLRLLEDDQVYTSAGQLTKFLPDRMS